MDIATGVVGGWIGKIKTEPVAPLGCRRLPHSLTPGWCLGGSAEYGMEEGALYNANSIAFDGTQILNGQGTNYPGVKRWDAVSGAYNGIMGYVNTGPTLWSQDQDLATLQGFDDISFNRPAGLAMDNSNLYISDVGGGLIKKVITATGAIAGWIGGMATSPTAGDPVCIGSSPFAFTPGWCLGALFQPDALWNTFIVGLPDGIMRNPTAISSDGTYLYAVDSAYHRIQKFRITDGAYLGWIGGVGSSPTSGCTGVAGQYSTSGWCKGGSPTIGWQDGYLSTPTGIYVSGGYLYVIDSGNQRVSRYNALQGTFDGWIGLISSAPATGCTPATVAGRSYSNNGWCKGGQSTAVWNDPGPGFYFSSNSGITGDGTYLYISNSYLSRIDKYNLNGAYQGSVRSRPDLGNTWFNFVTGSAASKWGWEGWYIRGIYADGTHIYGIIQDYVWPYYYYVFKRNLSTAAFVGWQGGIGASSPTGGDPGCVGSFGATPGWCIGGTIIGGLTFGKFSEPVSITGDSNFIYISDTDTRRVTRLAK